MSFWTGFEKRARDEKSDKLKAGAGAATAGALVGAATKELGSFGWDHKGKANKANRSAQWNMMSHARTTDHVKYMKDKYGHNFDDIDRAHIKEREASIASRGKAAVKAKAIAGKHTALFHLKNKGIPLAAGLATAGAAYAGLRHLQKKRGDEPKGAE